jgi:hypothetical protein
MVPVGANGAAVAAVEAFDLEQADLHGGTIGLRDPGLTLERGMYYRRAAMLFAAALSSSQVASLIRGRPCGSPRLRSSASIASQPA